MLRWLVEHPLGIEVCRTMTKDRKIIGLLRTAAENGQVEIMKYLYDRELADEFNVAIEKTIDKGRTSCVKWFIDTHVCDESKKGIRAIDRAAEYGHVEILKVFQSTSCKKRDAKRRWTDSWWLYAMDPIYWAAKGGHLAVLEWLQSNRSQQCGADAMGVAAGQGHLDVVKWLHVNRSEGCTYGAMDQAAASGHLNVLQWLHVNRSEGCSDLAMYRAAEHGHLEVIEWLYTNIPESRTCRAIDRAIRSGHLSVASWLLSRFPDYRIGSLLDLHKSLVTFWGDQNSFEMLLWLHVRARYVFTSRFLENIRKCLDHCFQYDLLLGHISTWLDENYPKTKPEK